MSDAINGLRLDALRNANIARLPEFKNKRGERAHSKADGSDWCLAQWSNACLGELGEAANLIKKIERGDLGLEDARAELGKELADVLVYLDILAYRAGIDLGRATVDKFNEVSIRVGSRVRLSADDWHYAQIEPIAAMVPLPRVETVHGEAPAPERKPRLRRRPAAKRLKKAGRKSAPLRRASGARA